MKYKHYAPKAPLILLDGDDAERMVFLKNKIKTLEKEGKKCAVIAYSEECALLSSFFPNLLVFDFGSRKSESEQANLLFARLRETDEFDLDEIYAPLPGLQGMGLALYNRMIRAAAHRILRV